MNKCIPRSSASEKFVLVGDTAVVFCFCQQHYNNREQTIYSTENAESEVSGSQILSQPLVYGTGVTGKSPPFKPVNSIVAILGAVAALVECKVNWVPRCTSVLEEMRVVCCMSR